VRCSWANIWSEILLGNVQRLVSVVSAIHNLTKTGQFVSPRMWI
jgi:hypothetical protein